MPFRGNRSHEPRPAGVVGENCDRCNAPGRVRVGKDLPAEIPSPPYSDAPLHLDLKRYDLVLCTEHYGLHAEALQAQRFMTLDDRR